MSEEKDAKSTEPEGAKSAPKLEEEVEGHLKGYGGKAAGSKSAGRDDSDADVEGHFKSASPKSASPKSV
jgi:hypothetical protein